MIKTIDLKASHAPQDFVQSLQETGYFPLLSENAKGYSAEDLKEFFHIYLNREKCNYPAGIGDATKQLLEQLSTLAETLL